MTRFMMSLENSVDLVLFSFSNIQQGDIFVQSNITRKGGSARGKGASHGGSGPKIINIDVSRHSHSAIGDYEGYIIGTPRRGVAQFDCRGSVS